MPDTPETILKKVCENGNLKNFKGATLRVLYLILARRNEFGVSKLTQSEIGFKCGIGRTAIYGSINELVNAGIIKEIKRPLIKDMGHLGKSQSNNFYFMT